MHYKITYCNRFSLSPYFWSFSLHSIYEYNWERIDNFILFLDPIIEAQTKSEDEFANILGKVKFASNQPSAILLIDSDLKKK